MQTNISRRQFINAAAAAGVSLGLGGCVKGIWKGGKKSKVTSSLPNKNRRPNIIFLLTDDQRAGMLGCEGHPFIKTPNIDALARGGVRFENAFIAEPVCSPSRATYFTGQFERTHRVGFSSPHDMTDRQWEDTYPALLQKKGYYTGFIGKFGLENYEFRPHAEEKFDFWLGHDGWAAFFAKRSPNCFMYKDMESEIITPIMSECMDEFLDTAPDDKPFCLSVSFSAPHGSISGSMYPGENGDTRMIHPANENPEISDHPIYGDLYRDQQVNISDDTGTDPYRYIPERVMPQELRKLTYSYNYDKDTNTEHRYRYLQLITGVDKAVGNLMESLKKRGLADNTVIIYSSDHGLIMGEYGMGGKSLQYDLATRIPFIIYDPDIPIDKRGRVLDDFAISIDVAPTIVSLAGMDVPETMQGIDLSNAVYGNNYDKREEIFLESMYVGRKNPFMETVRTDKYKYIRYFPNPGEPIDDESFSPHYGRYPDMVLDFRNRTPIFEHFFDLENDPQEKNNLIYEASLQKIIQQFREKCDIHAGSLVDFSKKYSQSRGF